MTTLKLPQTLATDLLDRLEARLAPFPLIDGWGVEIRELQPGKAVVAAGPSPRMVNPGGDLVNGGAVATLADMACALALCTAFDGRMPFATSDLHIRYLERAQGALTVEAQVVRLSARGAVIESRVHNDAGVVALCTCHFAIHLPKA